MGAVWMDLIGVLILGYNVLRGVSSGLVRTSVGAMAMALASYTAWQHPGAVGFLVDGWLPATWRFAFLVRPFAVWVVVFAALTGLGVALRWLVHVTPLALADRVGGGIFGFLTGLSILVTPLLLVASFPLLQQIAPLQELIGRSLLAQAMGPLVQILMQLAPPLPGALPPHP